MLESGVSGDFTIYRNPKVVENVQNLIGYHFLGYEAVNAGNGILGAAGIAVGIGTTSAGRFIAARAMGNAAIIAEVGLIGAAAAGLGLMALDFGINLACTIFKSGYYGGTLDWVD